jgi:hypothetical protein
VIFRREGFDADNVKGEFILMERVDEDRRTRAFVGTYESDKEAGVIVAEAVPCYT